MCNNDGGPGGYAGGYSGSNPSSGHGPGGGGSSNSPGGRYASYGTRGTINYFDGLPAGAIYGNQFILPMIGGSGGGGGNHVGGRNAAAGGGGALLIAADTSVRVDGAIYSRAYSDDSGFKNEVYSGYGSGGAVRLITPTITGIGSIDVGGGNAGKPNYYGGDGRIRFDCYNSNYGGLIRGVFTQGFQPIIFPVPNQGIQLNIASIGGVAVGGNPSGVLVNPDVIIPAQQANPLNVVVNCTNIPLNTDIIKVHPANGPDVTATAKNTAGTLAASTATISVAMPHGGGIIYASAVPGIAAATSATDAVGKRFEGICQTGWTADGEKFVAMEITAGLGGKQSVSYLTDSGKRYAMPVN